MKLFRNEGLFIDIRTNDTFQTVINNLYFMLSKYVKPYKYLEEWIIVEKETDIHIVIREVGELIPASVIFKPDTKWKIMQLKKPYNAFDSSERIREQRNNYR